MSIDDKISIFLSQNHNIISDGFFSLLSLLGEGMIIWIVLTIIVLYKTKKLSLLLVMPLLYGLPWVISDYFIKHAVHRIRPYLTLHLMPVGFIIPHSYSFPSGHTLSSFLAATILSYLAPKYTKWFYLLAFLIGLSRLYCEVHYLSDVMVGALLGIIAGYLGVYVLKIISHKKMIVKNETK